MSFCGFYIRPSEKPLSVDEIREKITNGSVDEKVIGLKELIKGCANDQHFPPMLMLVITSIVPIQQKWLSLRKVMLLYWEVVEKTKSPTDKSLKEQVFLACNSLRHDLISHNQYVSGRTLRLVSRIMHRGVIEPLASAITKSLSHKSAYVRRNAVVCLYSVFMAFGSDVIGDIDDQIEQLLLTETDLSTKRNAFILLFKTNPKKAISYVENKVRSQTIEEIGDILQLAILKVFRSLCSEQPTLKPKLLKMIADFEMKGTESVKLECAHTATLISNSATTIKSALNSYVSIMARSGQINVKKMLMDRFSFICGNSSYIDDDLVIDLIKCLDSPSIQLKQKVFQIIAFTISPKTVPLVLKIVQQELQPSRPREFITELAQTIQFISVKHSQFHDELLRIILQKGCKVTSLNYEGKVAMTNTLKNIVVTAKGAARSEAIKKLISEFPSIQSVQLLKAILNTIGSYVISESEACEALTHFKSAVGMLPLELQQNTDANLEDRKESKKIFKTVVGENGSYTSQLVEARGDGEVSAAASTFIFRSHLCNDSIVGGVFARNIRKLMVRLLKTPHFTRYACDFLLILCSLLKNYQSNQIRIDQAIVSQISKLIKEILNPSELLEHKEESSQSQSIAPLSRISNPTNRDVVEKYPGDGIVFRLLKKDADDAIEFEFDDEEINVASETNEPTKDFIGKLNTLIEMTGPLDPLFVTAFVTVVECDLTFDITIHNISKQVFQNIQVDFVSLEETIVLEKTPRLLLKPNESSTVRTKIRFAKPNLSTVYGYVNFDNNAGIEQPYLVTSEIHIDYMQYIEVCQVSVDSWKSQWEKAEQEAVLQRIIPSNSIEKVSLEMLTRLYERELHMKCVDFHEDQQNRFKNCRLIGKSKLGEYVLFNLCILWLKNITFTATIRSKSKVAMNIVMNRIRQNISVSSETQQ